MISPWKTLYDFKHSFCNDINYNQLSIAYIKSKGNGDDTDKYINLNYLGYYAIKQMNLLS